MKAKIRAHLLWMLASAALAIVTAIGGPCAAQADTPVQAQAQNGRYVIVHSPYARADTLLLDTWTGKTWSLVTYTDVNGDPRVWRPIPQANTDADLSALVARNGLKDKK